MSGIPRLFYSRLALFLGGALMASVGIWWVSCRSKSSQPVTAPPIAYYEPFEVVPESIAWPKGEPVLVETVKPPTKKDRDELASDFHLNPDDVAILGRFKLPELDDGGEAVITAPRRSDGLPGPAELTVKRNPPPPKPLFTAEWSPRFEGWYGYAAEPGYGIQQSWAAYISANDLLCVKEEVCVNARAGREYRPWGEGWTAELGLSWRF